MPTLSPNQVETIFRDENYEAFMSELPLQCEDLEEQGFYDLFPEKKIKAYSTFKTNVLGSYDGEAGRNPGEALNPGTMQQGYAYYTAIRSEFNEVRSIPAEYLASTLKLGDYAAEQGSIMARNYAQSYAEYWTYVFSQGAIPAATLLATGVGAPGRRPRSRLYNHAIKGDQGAIIAEVPNTDAADPDGATWFAATHTRSNGDTSASYAGKSLGFFNLGSSVTNSNLVLSEQNLENVLLHMENDLPWTADRVFRSARTPDTLIVSGNLRSLATQILDLNEYRMGSANNDKNVLYKQSKVFGIKNLIVNRFLPDNCWYVGAKGHGCSVVKKDGGFDMAGTKGPIDDTWSNIYIDMGRQTWIRQFFGFWSHWFDDSMDMSWYAGSTSRTLDSNNHPAAVTAASLVNWAA